MKRTSKNYIKLPFVEVWVKGSRCPWHYINGEDGEKWGWNLNKDSGMRRFGGGWRWKCGIVRGNKQLLIEWVYGTFHVVTNPEFVEKRFFK